MSAKGKHAWIGIVIVEIQYSSTDSLTWVCRTDKTLWYTNPPENTKIIIGPSRDASFQVHSETICTRSSSWIIETNEQRNWKRKGNS